MQIKTEQRLIATDSGDKPVLCNDGKVYFTENKFIRLADLPPDPTNIKALEHYRQLGMNVCLLTEDQVKLVKNGTVSPDYEQAIQNISDCGMQVWILHIRCPKILTVTVVCLYKVRFGLLLGITSHTSSSVRKGLACG